MTEHKIHSLRQDSTARLLQQDKTKYHCRILQYHHWNCRKKATIFRLEKVQEQFLKSKKECLYTLKQLFINKLNFGESLSISRADCRNGGHTERHNHPRYKIFKIKCRGINPEHISENIAVKIIIRF